MVKMKVGGMPLADDLSRVEAVKSILPRGGKLAVDANSKFDRDEALAYARGLAPFGLRWFEEPCDPLDFALLGRNRRTSTTRRCRPARICSRPRTSRTSCASAA